MATSGTSLLPNRFALESVSANSFKLYWNAGRNRLRSQEEMHVVPTVSDDYLAGLFDGEGCVFVGLTNGYMSLCVKVCMCDRVGVEVFAKRFGGSVSSSPPQKAKRSLHFTWVLNNGFAAPALEMFAERCAIKKEVASLALPIARQMAINSGSVKIPDEERSARLEAARKIRRINNPHSAGGTLYNEVNVAKYFSWNRDYGRRKIIDEHGLEFPSVSDAARALGVSVTAVGHALRDKHRCCGRKWRYVDGD